MSDSKVTLPILVPVDFSPASVEALAWAADLVACKKTGLVVLHVVHDLGEALGYYTVKGRKKQLHRIEDAASDMLDDLQKEMIKKYTNRLETFALEIDVIEKLRQSDYFAKRIAKAAQPAELAEKST